MPARGVPVTDQQQQYTVDDDQARSVLGKRILVRLTYAHASGHVDSVEEFWGVIERVNLNEGLVLRMPSSEERSLPPDLANLEAAPAGEYPLQGSSEIISNPDFLAAWTVPLQPPAELPRWVQVPAGLLLGAFTLLCLLGSLTMVFGANEKAPVLAPLFGVVWTLGCCWILQLCGRLVMGWRNTGGLMGPTALRSIAWLFLLLPVGGLFTGYFVSHPMQGALQVVAYVAIFFALRRIANARSGGEA
jgi:hypothetical protein